MKGTSKCDYLQFNNLWQRKKGYEAHKRRLNSVKGSEYFKQIEKDQIDDIVNHQIQCNKKKEEVKWKAIQQDNALILKRIIEITNSKPKQFVLIQLYSNFILYQSPRNSINRSPSPSPKQIRREFDKKIIERENQKIKQRLSSVQPHLNHKEFIDDFNKHIYYKNRMEKFIKDQNKITLKALNNISLYESSLNSRYNNALGPQTNRSNDHQNQIQTSNLFQTNPIQPSKNKNKKRKRYKKNLKSQNDNIFIQDKNSTGTKTCFNSHKKMSQSNMYVQQFEYLIRNSTDYSSNAYPHINTLYNPQNN